MIAAVLAARALLAFTFAWAAISKVWFASESDAMIAGVAPRLKRIAGPLRLALVIAEAAVVGVLWRPIRAWSLLVCTGLLVLFALVSVTVALQQVNVACRCFGLHSEALGIGTLVRSALQGALVVIAARSANASLVSLMSGGVLAMSALSLYWLLSVLVRLQGRNDLLARTNV